MLVFQRAFELLKECISAKRSPYCYSISGGLHIPYMRSNIGYKITDL